MLDGKVVVITGANGGLGTSVTRAFLDAGAQVVGISRSMRAEEFAHPRFAAESVDITGAEQAQALVARIVGKFGRLDSFVHLVGGFAGGTAVEATPEATFARMLDINFYSFHRLAQAILSVMQKQGSGSVLAIGSRTAVEPAATLGAYSASKAALVSLVRTIALENKQSGITANVILPGTMDTPANRAAMPQVDPKQWVQPSQVAGLLVHLASASQITGAVIPIYGGEL